METVWATDIPALLEVLWKAAALDWLVVFSTFASKGLTAPVLKIFRKNIKADVDSCLLTNKYSRVVPSLFLKYCFVYVVQKANCMYDRTRDTSWIIVFGGSRYEQESVNTMTMKTTK